MNTHFCQIVVRCKVDIAVDAPNGTDYFNLRLEIPCHVVRSPIGPETAEQEGEDEEDEVEPLDELIFGEDAWKLRSSDPTHPSSFLTNDIRKDLKVLSLHIADRCGLRPPISESTD